MTESEAIELIEKDLKLHSKDLSGKYKNSLRMAINALEKQIPRRPDIESDGFTDDLLNMGFTKGYNKAIDDAKSVILQTLDNEMLVDTLHLRLEQLKAGD